MLLAAQDQNFALLEEKSEQIIQLELDCKELQEMLDQSRLDSDSTSSEISVLQQAIEEAQAEVERLCFEKESVETNNQKLQDDVIALQEENALLQNQVEGFEVSDVSIQARFEELEKEYALLQVLYYINYHEEFRKLLKPVFDTKNKEIYFYTSIRTGPAPIIPGDPILI